VEERLGEVAERVARLEGSVNSSASLIKWVIFPLMMILAALIGLKLTMPGG